jgi:mono/diheme cytochrome c family protein
MSTLAPIAGMARPPRLDPGDVHRTAEVALVLRLGEPACLAGGFAGRVAFLLLPLAQTASAQTAGDAAAGKAYWDRLAPRQTDCKDCHNLNGEGGFGPDLAGRGLSAAQVLRAVRQPWGVMPAFAESQVSAKDAADIAAYFATLPKVAEPDGWNVEVPPGAPPGQATMINMGCGQCHGATFNGPRANMGLSGMNFDYFANLVYNHTTAMPQYRKEIGNPATNLDMGNFNRARLTMGQLRQIYLWARDEIGVRAPMAAQIAKGEPGPSGVTYPVTVTNNGLPGRGVIAEGLTISLATIRLWWPPPEPAIRAFTLTKRPRPVSPRGNCRAALPRTRRSSASRSPRPQLPPPTSKVISVGLSHTCPNVSGRATCN